MAGEAVCKGAWLLGTACGVCQRCRDSAGEAAELIRKQGRAIVEAEASIQNLKRMAEAPDVVYVITQNGGFITCFRDRDKARDFMKVLDEPKRMWQYQLVEARLQ